MPYKTADQLADEIASARPRYKTADQIAEEIAAFQAAEFKRVTDSPPIKPTRYTDVSPAAIRARGAVSQRADPQQQDVFDPETWGAIRPKAPIAGVGRTALGVNQPFIDLGRLGQETAQAMSRKSYKAAEKVRARYREAVRKSPGGALQLSHDDAERERQLAEIRSLRPRFDRYWDREIAPLLAKRGPAAEAEAERLFIEEGGKFMGGGAMITPPGVYQAARKITALYEKRAAERLTPDALRRAFPELTALQRQALGHVFARKAADVDAAEEYSQAASEDFFTLAASLLLGGGAEALALRAGAGLAKAGLARAFGQGASALARVHTPTFVRGAQGIAGAVRARPALAESLSGAGRITARLLSPARTVGNVVGGGTEQAFQDIGEDLTPRERLQRIKQGGFAGGVGGLVFGAGFEALGGAMRGPGALGRFQERVGLREIDRLRAGLREMEDRKARPALAAANPDYTVRVGQPPTEEPIRPMLALPPGAAPDSPTLRSGVTPEVARPILALPAIAETRPPTTPVQPTEITPGLKVRITRRSGDPTRRTYVVEGVDGEMVTLKGRATPVHVDTIAPQDPTAGPMDLGTRLREAADSLYEEGRTGLAGVEQKYAARLPRGRSGGAGAAINPVDLAAQISESLPHWTRIGAGLVMRGVSKFPDWAQAMSKEIAHWNKLARDQVIRMHRAALGIAQERRRTVELNISAYTDRDPQIKAIYDQAAAADLAGDAAEASRLRGRRGAERGEGAPGYEKTIAQLRANRAAILARIKSPGLMSGGLGVDPALLRDLALLAGNYLAEGGMTAAQALDRVARDVPQVWSRLSPQQRQQILDSAGRFASRAGGRTAIERTPIPERRPSGLPPEEYRTGEGEPTYAGNIRIENLENGEQVRSLLLQQVEERGAMIELQRRNVQSMDQMRQESRRLGINVDKLNLRPGTALNASEIFALREALLSAGEKFRRAQQAFDRSERGETDYLRVATALREFQVVDLALRGATAEAGRALRQFQEMARASRDPNRDIRMRALEQLRRAAGDRELLEQELAALSRAGDDPYELTRLLRRTNEVPLFERLRSYQQANLLSSPVGAAQDFLGTLAYNVVERGLVAPLRAGIEAGRARVTGQARGYEMAEVVPGIVGMAVGFRRGLSDAAEVMREGMTRQQAERLDTAGRGREFRGGRWNPWNQSFRQRAAVDAINREMIRSSELHTLAARQATQEGLSGAARASRYQHLLREPTEQMLEQADAAASHGVFVSSRSGRDDPVLRRIMAFANLGEDVLGGAKPLRVILPFVRTNYYLQKAGLEFTPAGLIVGALRRDVRGTAAMSDLAARAVLGTAALIPLLAYGATGGITGPAPKNATDREEFYRLGKKPWAVKIGNQWVEFLRLGPLAQPLVIAAAFAKRGESNEKEPTSEWIATVGASLGSAMVDTTALTGLRDLNNAISDPETWGQRFFERAASGFVPLVSAQRLVTNITDPNLRETKLDESKAESLFDGIAEGSQRTLKYIQSGIPGLSQKLPARVDNLGRPIPRSPSGIAALSPLRASRANAQPVDRELARLGIRPSSLRPDLKEGREERRLTQTQLRQMTTEVGSAVRTKIEREMAKPGYGQQPDEKKRERLEDAIKDARAAARDRYLRGIGIRRRGSGLGLGSLGGL